MTPQTVTPADLPFLSTLQPLGWPDITPEFEFYLRYKQCTALKVEIDGRIVGTGASIIFGASAWIAHIIVHPDYRKTGIGTLIVERLLQQLDEIGIRSILLISTEIGKPVYLRAGFTEVEEYLFFNRTGPAGNAEAPSNLFRYQPGYRREILELDRLATGEDRSWLLDEYLPGAILSLNRGRVTGYFIPDLRDGPVVAAEPWAGLKLLDCKCGRCSRVVIPAGNQPGIDHLAELGFVRGDTKGTRMLKGANIPWQPQKIFSRIGGNFG